MASRPPKPPDAFLSYTRFDDRRGDISAFRNHLEDAVREVTGEPFEIFQDVDDIEIGERWSVKLDEMLAEARFFIPIITPSYFTSAACRDELQKFLKAEERAGRRDLILPIYYIRCPVLEDKELRRADDLATAIHQRQRWDWRELRHHSFRNRNVRVTIAALAEAIAAARQTRVTHRPEVATTSVVQVRYDGYGFGSEAEARWAVFFNAVGLKYEYEIEGYPSDGFWYPPTFWLPEIGFRLWVAEDEPSDAEQTGCRHLADISDRVVLIAIGAPEPRDQLLVISPSGSSRFSFPGHEGSRFYFADDRRNEGELWLLSDAGAGSSIGPQTGPDHGRYPGLYRATRRGYEAAQNARFEHGNIISAPVPVSPPDVGAEALLSQPISKETLEAYTKWKYPDLPVDEKIQRLLIRDLDEDRYKTIGDLDRVANAASDAVDHYKQENPEWFKAGTDYLTKSLGFADDHFRERHPFAQRTREAFSQYRHLVRPNG